MEKYILKNGIILDGTKEMQPLTGHVIVVNEDKIEAVLDENDEKLGTTYADYMQLDLGGKYIMPGLINMHVHLAGNGKPQKKQRDNEALVKKIMSTRVTRMVAKNMVKSYAQIELESGVTTIRTVGGLGEFDTEVRDEINEGKYPGPRIIAANRGISVPGGHMAGSVAVATTSPEEAVKLAKFNNSKGVDLIKLMVTGGVMDAKEKGVPGELKMSPEIIKAVCDYAHENGFIVAAHTESPQGVKVALENGVDSIEHGAKPDDEMIALFKERNAFVCTTLSPALPYALFDRSISHASEVEQFNGNVVFEGIIECAKAALENDIPIALGNDVGCPYVSQYDFWRELVYFTKYVGVSNAYALHTATLGNATLAGISDITGSIEAGKSADMIVTTANPLDDLHALRKVDMVIMRGLINSDPKVKRKAEVDRELDKFC